MNDLQELNNVPFQKSQKKNFWTLQRNFTLRATLLQETGIKKLSAY
jgi:hypothetical protein